MGLFSVRGRLPRPARRDRIGTLPVRVGLAVRAAIRNAGNAVATGLRDIRLAVVAAIDDARIVAALLALAAVALGLEMAASFHLI
jgi:hypothetical protein